jgi:hypothetical protein
VVHRIQQRSVGAMRRVSRRGERAVEAAREEVLTAIEQLGDIALNSVDKKDKAISLAAITAMTELVIAHVEMKPRMPPGWFSTDVLVGNDQDFVAMHPDVMTRVAARRTWVEMKILRQCQATFDEALLKLRDMGHLIAIETRRIATLAEKHGDLEGAQVAMRFMNTYMRATLKAADQRSAYDLMNEYRALAESFLGAGRHDLVIMLGERCKFYGQLAFRMRLPFVLETAAYDLCTLLERAHHERAACHEALLEIFLDVDRADEGDTVKEASLRGVRKAQTKLATYYLDCGEIDLARRIFDDMRHEPPARLRSIHADLLEITDAEWWEVSDRGVNFEYLPPSRRAQLETFFGWFEAIAKVGHPHALRRPAGLRLHVKEIRLRIDERLVSLSGELELDDAHERR